MDFALFVVATGVLFLRPLDFVPELATLPLFLVCLGCAAVAAGEPLLKQLSPGNLAARPASLCVIGMLLAIVLSQLCHGAFWEARTAGADFLKVLLYYLVLLAVVRTPGRLRSLLMWLAVFFAGVALLALLEYHGVIDLPQMAVLQQRDVDEETGDISIIPRLVGYGLFNDPNDLCLMLLVGMGIATYFALEGDAGPARLAWVALTIMFGYALALTQSRGGFIALMVAMGLLFHARYGPWKAAMLVGAVLPVLFLAFAGRQTSFTSDGDAGSDRFALWREALEAFKESPLFGIGRGEFEERAGLVAHNSYVHCFAELGYFGGTLFLGAVLTVLWGLYRLGRPDAAITDPVLKRLRPYLLAMLGAYAAGIISLTRCYIVPTYMMIGLGAVFLALAGTGRRLPLPRFGGGYVGGLAGASVGFLVGLNLFLKVMALRG